MRFKFKYIEYKNKFVAHISPKQSKGCNTEVSDLSTENKKQKHQYIPVIEPFLYL